MAKIKEKAIFEANLKNSSKVINYVFESAEDVICKKIDFRDKKYLQTMPSSRLLRIWAF